MYCECQGLVTINNNTHKHKHNNNKHQHNIELIMIVIMMMILLDCDFGFQAIPLTLRLNFFLPIIIGWQGCMRIWIINYSFFMNFGFNNLDLKW